MWLHEVKIPPALLASHWVAINCTMIYNRCALQYTGERDEFEKYYRKQRRQQASLTLQPPANMHESIDG